MALKIKVGHVFLLIFIIGMWMQGGLFASTETKELTARLASKGVLSLREGEKELTYEEYLLVLEKWQQQLAETDSLIRLEEEKIAQLKDEITQTEQAIENTLQETYDMLGITQADVDALDAAIAALSDKISELEIYSAEELQDKKADVKASESELDSLKNLPAALLFEQRDALAALDSRLAEVRERMESYVPPAPDTYTIIRGDWLSKIAEYDVFFGKGNFHMWPKIFQANRDMIISGYKKANEGNRLYTKPEDLIFPQQEFVIPR